MQRIADLLVERGLAQYQPNPAHARAELLAPTQHGRQSIRTMRADVLTFARSVADVVGEDDLRHAAAIMDRIIAALPTLDR